MTPPRRSKVVKLPVIGKSTFDPLIKVWVNKKGEGMLDEQLKRKYPDAWKKAHRALWNYGKQT